MKIVAIIVGVLAALLLLGILCSLIIVGEALRQTTIQEDNMAENEPMDTHHNHFDPGGMYV